MATVQWYDGQTKEFKVNIRVLRAFAEKRDILEKLEKARTTMGEKATLSPEELDTLVFILSAFSGVSAKELEDKLEVARIPEYNTAIAKAFEEAGLTGKGELEGKNVS